MRFESSRLRKRILMLGGAALLAVGVAAGGAEIARQYCVDTPSASHIFLFPGGNPANDADVARLDTRTGAVYRYRGQLNNPNVRGSWELRVPAPKESHSGMLEIQRVVVPQQDATISDVEPATLLVDVVTGKTWVLHLRASSNGTWDYIPIFTH